MKPKKVSFFTFLHTLCSVALIAIGLLLVTPFLCICLVVPKKYRFNRVLFCILALIYRIIAYSLLVPIKITGRGNIPQEPCIIAANHQSFIDTPVLGLIVGVHPHLWLALDHYAQKPLLGCIIRRLAIVVNQENSRAAAQAVINALSLAEKAQAHILIFPEGGRYNDEQVHQFFSGVALLAKKTKRPIIPVYMPSNGGVLPIGSYTVNFMPISVIIGKAEYYSEQETHEQFNARLHKWFIEKQNSYFR